MELPKFKCDKLIEYGNLDWKWRGKDYKLKNMAIGQLEQCLKFIKESKRQVIFGNNKRYLITAIKEVIKDRSDKDYCYLVARIQEYKIKQANKYVNKLMSTHKIFKNINNKMK